MSEWQIMNVIHLPSLFGRAFTTGQTQTGLGPRAYPFTNQLPGSDAGSDVVKPASSFII